MSNRFSKEVVDGSSVARSPAYNEAKKHALIQIIEHVFKEDEHGRRLPGGQGQGIRDQSSDQACLRHDQRLRGLVRLFSSGVYVRQVEGGFNPLSRPISVAVRSP